MKNVLHRLSPLSRITQFTNYITFLWCAKWIALLQFHYANLQPSEVRRLEFRRYAWVSPHFFITL